ncbi:hypothetical protein L2755_05825 [Shewanella abyssi]|uniref:hypothetical protein n=1 Tax=Shewanella abyssi TaxID=311789 RepID=UPI00200DB635|nr:hypothetical protein [Shewanella abyssi]MCL1049141.1 hypothetical protein [Shewanella abyssi]
MDDKNTPSENKGLSISCNSCQRMTVIEGEYVCFREGEIISLQPMKTPSQKNLLCDGWKIGKLNY